MFLSLSVVPLLAARITRKFPMATYEGAAASCQGSRESTQRAVGETRGSQLQPCRVYWGEKNGA